MPVKRGNSGDLDEIMGTTAPNHRLKTELETYEKNREALLAEEGKFVLIQGTTIQGIWGTYEDALKVGYEKFGLSTPFLVKQISGIETIYGFTRDLVSCQS